MGGGRENFQKRKKELLPTGGTHNNVVVAATCLSIGIRGGNR